MNREILFRGKRIENGEWVYGSLVLWYDGSMSIETGVYDAPMYAVDPATIGQYTGLTDKNGKRIFEGDIIAFDYDISEVKMSDGCWGLDDDVTLLYDLQNVEVIGNIYDNYEFLEGE